MARFQFLYKVIKEYVSGADSSCPYCKCHETKLIGRKYILLQLLYCKNCKLMFRYPKDSENTNLDYYEKTYDESGITSNIPTNKDLEEYLKTKFCNTEKDFAEKIHIIKQFSKNSCILDYGCSWGYATWQLQEAGFKVVGFEISKSRAKFGREKLGLTIIDKISDLDLMEKKSFDVIFTNHALEHHPNLFNIFETFSELIKQGGYLMIFVPNCIGLDNKKVFNQKKNYAFGEKHSLAFDRYFFEINLPKYGFKVQCTSSPYDINNLFAEKGIFNDTEYSELFILARKVG